MDEKIPRDDDRRAPAATGVASPGRAPWLAGGSLLGWATIIATAWGLLYALATAMSLGFSRGYASAAIGTALLVGILFWLLRARPVAAFLAVVVIDQAISTGANWLQFHRQPISITLLGVGLALLPLLAGYHLGRRASARRAIGAGAVYALLQAGNWVWLALETNGDVPMALDNGHTMHLSGLALTTFFQVATRILAPIGLGMMVRRELTAFERALALAATERARRDEELTEVLRADRQRMARELHDLAAHHSTAAVINAKAARKLSAAHPESVPGLIDDVVTETQAAQSSLRQMVDVLHDPDDAVPRAPQPTLADIPALIERTRTIHPDTVFEMDDETARGVPDSVALAAYRIVQESITNAHRHAPGAPLTIALWTDDEVLMVQVINGRSTRLVDAGGGSGRGIAGMRQRAELLGGSLQAGEYQRGWQVLAELPLAQSGDDQPACGGASEQVR